MRELELGSALDALIDHRGKTPKKLGAQFESTGVPVVSAVHVKEGRLLLDGVRFVSSDLYAKWMPIRLRAGDVILTSEAPLGEVARVSANSDLVLGQRVFGLRGKAGLLDSGFLYYLLKWEPIRQQMIARSTGTTVHGIRQSELVKVHIPVPEIGTQLAIANRLGALDDKIDLNRRVNETAQSLVEARFDAGFASARETTTLGVIANITMGQSPPGSTYNSDGNGLPFYQGSSDFGPRFPARRISCTAPTRIASAGDVLISVRAPVGALNLADVECGIGRGVAAISEKGGLGSYLYYLMRATRGGWDHFNGVGTVFGAVTKDGVNSFPVPRHSESTRVAFDEWAKAFDALIAANTRESETLAALRDALLPELISGRMTVN